MMVWLLFIIDLMGLFFYNKIGSIISIGDLPTTNIIEPKITWEFFYLQISSLGNFFLDIFFQSGKIVLMKTYLVLRRTKCDS